MKNFEAYKLPQLFPAVCVETGKMYIYNKNNEDDPVTGKWRVQESGTNDYTHLLNKPTKLSDFENDKNFIDDTTEALVNYYKKTETYTQAEVDQLISDLSALSILIVTELPSTPATNIMYFIQIAGTTSYNRYMYIAGEWKSLGSTDVDLSAYAKIADLADVATSGSYNDLEDKPDLPQVSIMPEAAAGNVGRVVQYVGSSSALYTNGFFYKCIETSGTYSWENIKVQTGGGEGGGELTANIIPNITVGGIKAGVTVPAGSTMQELFEKMLVEYQKPTITLSITPSTVLYEKGTTISTLTLSASATKKSENIASIKFYQGSTLLETITDGVASGGNFTCSEDIAAFSTDTTFKASVTDSVTGSTVDSTKTVEFIVPFYYGNSDTDTISALTGLTKDLSKKGSKTYTYTASNKYLCILYPSSYGTLSSIKDSNNFENIGNFNTDTVTIGDDTYRYYITKEGKTVSNFKFVFSF